MGKTYKNFFEESSKHLSKEAQKRADQRAEEIIRELKREKINSSGSHGAFNITGLEDIFESSKLDSSEDE